MGYYGYYNKSYNGKSVYQQKTGGGGYLFNSPKGFWSVSITIPENAITYLSELLKENKNPLLR